MPLPDLDHRATSCDPTHAYWLARVAQLAYSRPEVIDRQAKEWGFDHTRHHRTPHAPPFPVQDTKVSVLASDHLVVTAFQGTTPEEMREWLTDAAAPATPTAGSGLVHWGFGQALESVCPALPQSIEELRDNEQTVWFTGHGSGGALAVLAAGRLCFEDPHILADGICTFGQPRVGDPLHASAHNAAFGGRTIRFVNRRDAVPELPPEPRYRHVDTLQYLDTSQAVRHGVTRRGSHGERGRGVATDPLSAGSDGVIDHSLAQYVAVLEAALR